MAITHNIYGKYVPNGIEKNLPNKDAIVIILNSATDVIKNSFIVYIILYKYLYFLFSFFYY